MIELNRSMQSRAVKAIEGVHTAYHAGADSIGALEKRIADKRAAAAKHVFGLAVFAMQTNDGDRAKAIELYLALCDHAETAYKAAHKVTDLAEALPTWRVFKSNVLTGMRDHGLDPREFRSEGAFRTAKLKLAAAPAGPRRGPHAVVELPPPGEVVPPETVEQMLERVVPHEALRELVAQIVVDLEILKRSKTSEAQAILEEMRDRLHPLVDQRKVA